MLYGRRLAGSWARMVRSFLPDAHVAVRGLSASRRTSGNNSVVECDLAKVEVAGSNTVSRSIYDRRGPLHPDWLTALRSPFAARSAPFASVVHGVASRDAICLVRRPLVATARSATWGPEAHSAPRAVWRRGPASG